MNHGVHGMHGVEEGRGDVNQLARSDSVNSVQSAVKASVGDWPLTIRFSKYALPHPSLPGPLSTTPLHDSRFFALQLVPPCRRRRS
jgi:hypothetical protein